MRKGSKRRYWIMTPEGWGFSALLITGALVRIAAAWRYRHMTNLDAGVVALMAKHMAEGRHFPTFFYGQPHMGSLEAGISAVFCRMLGVSGFAVNLGTAALSLGLIPIVYFWARRAGGPRAAMIAGAYCVIGPHGFFHYNGSPRGGYAAALVFGALVTFLATRMVLRWREEREQTHADFLWLGIAAGLGWWSNQLVTASLLSAALLLLMAMGKAAFSLRIFTGLGGFLLGGLPFWIYNVRNDMATFRFADGVGSYPVVSGLRRLVTGRVPLLFLADVSIAPVKWGVAVLFLGVTGLGLWIWVRAFRKGNQAVVWTLGGILLYVTVFSLLFTQSHLALQPTPRYLLPWVAPLGVWMGVVLSKTDLRVAVAVTGLLIILPSGFLLGRSFPEQAASWHRATLTAGEELQDLGVDTVYAPIGFRSWNFILRESVAVVDLNRSVFPGQTARAELDPGLGVLGDAGRVSGFMRRAGVKGRHRNVGGFPLVSDFTGPPSASPLSGDRIISIRDSGGGEWKEALTNRDVSTVYRTGMAPSRFEDLILTLSDRTAVAGLRFWPGRPGEVPDELQVFIRDRPEDEWRKVSPVTPWSGFFWSDHRIFWQEPFFRLQIRFPEREVRQIRLRFRQIDTGPPVSISQLDVLENYDASGNAEADWEEVMEVLKNEGVDWVLADRGESVQLHRRSEGRVKTLLRKDAFPDGLSMPEHDLVIPAGGGVLVHRSQAGRIDSVLVEAAPSLRRIQVSGFDLWIAEQEVRLPGRVWKGCDIWMHPARYGEWRWAQGNREAALRHHPYLGEAPSPEKPFEIKFEKDLYCVGAEPMPEEVKPGQPLTLTTYWQVPEGEWADLRHLAVFAHWRSDDGMFTSDGAMLQNIPDAFLEVPPDHRTFPMTVQFRVPEEITPGLYRLWMGVYRPATGKRREVHTRLSSKKNAVQLPLQLNIMPASAL